MGSRGYEIKFSAFEAVGQARPLSDYHNQTFPVNSPLGRGGKSWQRQIIFVLNSVCSCAAWQLFSENSEYGVHTLYSAVLSPKCVL